MKRDVANRLPIDTVPYLALASLATCIIIIRHQSVTKLPEIEFNEYFLYITG